MGAVKGEPGMLGVRNTAGVLGGVAVLDGLDVRGGLGVLGGRRVRRVSRGFSCEARSASPGLGIARKSGLTTGEGSAGAT